MYAPDPPRAQRRHGHTAAQRPPRTTGIDLPGARAYADVMLDARACLDVTPDAATRRRDTPKRPASTQCRSAPETSRRLGASRRAGSQAHPSGDTDRSDRGSPGDRLQREPLVRPHEPVVAEGVAGPRHEPSQSDGAVRSAVAGFLRLEVLTA